MLCCVVLCLRAEVLKIHHFLFQWGPISPNKRRASVQTFLQAHGAAVDPLGLAVDPAATATATGRSMQDTGHRELHHEASLRVASRSNDSRDGEDAVRGLTKLNRIFGEALEEKDIDGEREDVQEEESYDEESKGPSVEEQLRQALER